jgi:hypothetical protein
MDRGQDSSEMELVAAAARQVTASRGRISHFLAPCKFAAFNRYDTDRFTLAAESCGSRFRLNNTNLSPGYLLCRKSELRKLTGADLNNPKCH